MGLFNIFSKKDQKKEIVEQPQQITEEYNIPVIEPVGELPVSNKKNEDNVLETPTDFGQQQFDSTSKFVATPINFDQSQNKIIFDDTKPASIYTDEQQGYISNNYFLSPSYKTTDEFSYVSNNNDKDDSESDDFSYVDDELPSANDDNFNNALPNLGDDNSENEHKFFTSSVDEIDSYKNSLDSEKKEKTKILGDASIFGIARIDDEGK